MALDPVVRQNNNLKSKLALLLARAGRIELGGFEGHEGHQGLQGLKFEEDE